MTYTGDFALLNPFPCLTDEDGTFHCPMPSLNRTWDDDDDWEKCTTHKALCGEELGVVWTLHCPVPDLDDNTTITQGDCGKWALFSRWELRCSAGHVLQTSHDDDGRDEASPFDSRHVFGNTPTDEATL